MGNVLLNKYDRFFRLPRRSFAKVRIVSVSVHRKAHTNTNAASVFTIKKVSSSGSKINDFSGTGRIFSNLAKGPPYFFMDMSVCRFSAAGSHFFRKRPQARYFCLSMKHFSLECKIHVKSDWLFSQFFSGLLW